MNKSFKYFYENQNVDTVTVFNMFLDGVTLIPVINNDRILVDLIIPSNFLKGIDLR
ncbi:hypothetical protein N8991_03565 [Schleiferiaceae bacterium]|nr:hypothetical protein [Schleiferiaceae bacterium]